MASVISELIEELEMFKEEHGDLPITFSDGNTGNTAFDFVDLRTWDAHGSKLAKKYYMCLIRHSGKVFPFNILKA